MGKNKECRACASARDRDDYIFDWDLQILSWNKENRQASTVILLLRIFSISAHQQMRSFMFKNWFLMKNGMHFGL